MGVSWVRLLTHFCCSDARLCCLCECAYLAMSLTLAAMGLRVKSGVATRAPEAAASSACVFAVNAFVGDGSPLMSPAEAAETSGLAPSSQASSAAAMASETLLQAGAETILLLTHGVLRMRGPYFVVRVLVVSGYIRVGSGE